MLLERICALIMQSFCTISSTSFHIALGCNVSSKTILNMVTKQTRKRKVKRKFNGGIVDYITESNNWFSESNTLANTPQTVNWIKECNLSRYRGGLGFKEIICCCFLVSHLYVTKDRHHFKNLTLCLFYFLNCHACNISNLYHCKNKKLGILRTTILSLMRQEKGVQADRGLSPHKGRK